jgi:hypothetical protein
MALARAGWDFEGAQKVGRAASSAPAEAEELEQGRNSASSL